MTNSEENQTLTHFSSSGRARMVNVADKQNSKRVAIASGIIRMLPATLQRIQTGEIHKGNVLTVADVAAVMAAKRTPDLIPMCHSIALSGVEVSFTLIEQKNSLGLSAIRAEVTTSCIGQTGVEMEALSAVSAALLTIYDMCKAIDKGMVIEQIQLEEKHGGKNGVWKRNGV